MRIRIALSKILIKVGGFIQSLAIAVLHPKDIIRVGRNTYGDIENIKAWGSPQLVDSGFFDNEKEILENLPNKKGRLLLLGSGGGRDAIALAKVGFSVTAIDFIPGMIEKTLENARRHGVKIEARVQEISKLQLDIDPFDIIWFSASMYSSVPTRKRRIASLRLLKGNLRASGIIICFFHWVPDKRRITLNYIFK
jgi:2-polyprenyl-3-methyl-5-hydroxy-6-metoxy-1,4-benzoquinol methylase